MELKERADKVIRELIILLQASCHTIDTASQTINQFATNLTDPMWAYGFRTDEDSVREYVASLRNVAAEMKKFKDQVEATDLDWEFTKKPTLFERANE